MVCQKFSFFVVFLGCSFLLMPLASAFFVNVSSEKIKESYIPSEKLTGSMNLSLREIASSSLLESSLGGSIPIKDFLDNNSASYNCNPVDCESTYSGDREASQKTFSLGAGEEKILGIKIEGDLKEDGITGFQFQVRSNAPASCAQPLMVDLLDDKDVQYAVNYSQDDFSCYSSQGCFSNQSLSEVFIDERGYCNKITLVPAPLYKAGAVVKKSGQAQLMMKLKRVLENNQSEEIEGAFCNLPDPTNSGAWNEVSCVIPYPIEKTEPYYVCLSTLEGVSNYTLQYEEQEPLCGFYDFFEENYTADYHIFAKAGRYGSFRNFVFNEENQNVNPLPLLSYVSQYLERRYQSNCLNGCILPITFLSGVQQEITIDGVQVTYSTQIGPKITSSLWDVAKGDALLSMGHQMVDLGASGFLAPRTYGSFPLFLSLESFAFLKKNITVKKVPIVSSLQPLQVAQSVTTRFKVTARSPENKSIVKYVWDFGDNTTAETDRNETDHSYAKIGIYTLEVTAIDSSGEGGTGSFQIIVGSAREAVNQTLKELKARLSSLQANLSSKWYRRSAEERLKLGEAEKVLNEAQRSFLSARTDDDYGKIAQKIEPLKLPLLIHEGNTVNVPFVFDIKKINFDHLEELGAGGTLDEEAEAYRNAIWAWFSQLEKYKEYKVVSAQFEQDIEMIGVLFKVDVKSDDLFLVIDRPHEHLQFLTDYQAVNLGGASGIASPPESITFFVQGKLNPDDLQIYLAPQLSSLEIGVTPEPCNYNKVCEKDLGETLANCKADCPPRKRMIFFLILLFLVAFMIYTFVQEWYRKRYESHLFKNKADLYNLLNFIAQALRQGLDKGAIAKKLKESGWNSEQISYAFKKIEGKRVGMPGFNILEILERKRNKKRFKNMQTASIARVPGFQGRALGPGSASRFGGGPR